MPHLETQLREKGGVYDSRDQVWKIPLAEIAIEPHIKEQCSMHVYVAPTHQRSLVPTENSFPTEENAQYDDITPTTSGCNYPFELPPFFVESDCGRFQNDEAERLIQAVVIQMASFLVGTVSFVNTCHTR